MHRCAEEREVEMCRRKRGRDIIMHRCAEEREVET